MAVGSVVNAIAILRHLATAPAPVGVNALARSLELSPSTCFNIVKTLVAEDFVSFDVRTKRYELAAAPVELFRGSAGDRLMLAVHDELEALSTDYALVCGLWEVRGDRLYLKEVIEPDVPTRIHLTRGQRLPRYVGAMGRCLATVDDLSRTDISRIIHTLRWQQAPATEAYMADLRRTAETGWAVDEGNYMKGVLTVAAAIVDASGNPRHCLTAIMFLGQHRADLVEHIGELLAEIAGRFSGSSVVPPPVARSRAAAVVARR